MKKINLGVFFLPLLLITGTFMFIGPVNGQSPILPNELTDLFSSTPTEVQADFVSYLGNLDLSETAPETIENLLEGFEFIEESLVEGFQINKLDGMFVVGINLASGWFQDQEIIPEPLSDSLIVILNGLGDEWSQQSLNLDSSGFYLAIEETGQAQILYGVDGTFFPQLPEILEGTDETGPVTFLRAGLNLMLNPAYDNGFWIDGGYGWFYANHYGLILEPKDAFFLNIEKAPSFLPSGFGLTWRLNAMAAKYSPPTPNWLPTGTGTAFPEGTGPAFPSNEPEDPKWDFLSLDAEITPLYGIGFGNTKLFGGIGYYVSILVPPFDHGIDRTSDNKGNSLAHGLVVVTGTQIQFGERQLTLMGKGKLGKIHKGPYDHKSVSGSSSFSFSDNLRVFYRFDHSEFAAIGNKTVNSHQAGIGTSVSSVANFIAGLFNGDTNL